MRKGHKPVLIRCSSNNLMLYCADCEVVWDVITRSLSYIPASDWSGERLGER